MGHVPRTLRATLTLLMVTLAGPVGAQQMQKIAVVDLERVVVESSAGKALQSRITTFQETVRTGIAERTQRGEAIRQQMTEGATTLGQDALSDLQRQFEDLSLELNRYREERQREGEQFQQEALREIEQQLEPVFREVMAEGDYDVILNNVPGVVVMAAGRVDITANVLERFEAASSTP